MAIKVTPREQAGRLQAKALLAHLTECQLCGRSRGISGALLPRNALCVHHCNGNPTDNRPENLVKVCIWCHRRIHELLELPDPLPSWTPTADGEAIKAVLARSILRRRLDCAALSAADRRAVKRLDQLNAQPDHDATA